MNQSLALRDSAQAVALSSDQLSFISRTEFIPQGLRGNLPAILACVTTGRELGLGDMTSLRSIHIIDGKASFSAELMVQLVRKQGHSITGDVSAEKAVVTGTRADNGDTMTMTWTLEMADRVGLLKKQNWVRYPESMLWARAVSQLCRMLFADCFAGASYTPEELGSEDETPDEVMHQPPALEGGEAETFEDLPVEALEDILGGEEVAAPDAAMATDSQKKKLDVLVGQLRDGGTLHTEHLYMAVAQLRGETVAHADHEGELRWRDLRETLSKDEASNLIERLTTLQGNAVSA